MPRRVDYATAVSTPPHTSRFRCVCLDWGGTLMSEDGPVDLPMARWPEVVAIDGAREMLAELSRDHRLAIATNATVSCREMIAAALDRVGLLPFIAEIFCFTELGVKKDSPAFWRAVSERLATPPDRIAMLGDSLEQDVLAPRRCGVYAVWFNPAGAALPAGVNVPMVRRLAEFPTLLRGAGLIGDV